MSEAPANPEEPAIVERCQICNSENIKRLSVFYDVYECADCGWLFDSSISYDRVGYLDEEDWED